MNQLWIVVAALVALLVFTRIRSRQRQNRQKRPAPGAGPRIQGQQVSAYVHPRMSAACLHDHGLQFGRGFRRKEGPPLPHDGQCRCEVIPFMFTSSEVFNGALRALGQAQSSIEGLTPADAARLIECLKSVESGPLPAAAAAYAAAVGRESFATGLQDALAAFLAERFAHLRHQMGEAGNLTEVSSADGVESIEST